MAEMDYREFLQRREIWEAEGNHLMSREDVARFDSFFADPNEAASYKSEGVTRALVGDFSQFESVEPMMKAYLGAKKCYDLYDRYQGDLSNPQLQQEIKERLMEADLRAGFAICGKDPEDPVSAFSKGCERIANQQMLIQTLEEPDPTAKLRVQNQLERESSENVQQRLNATLNEDLEKRVEIAKILFMNHLGKFQVQDANKNDIEMNENMAEVYAHGGRTMFILPAGKDQKPVMDGIQGSNPEVSGLQSRGWATHGVAPRKLNADGTIAQEAEELKRKLLAAYDPKHHKGMNASVGGLGQVGPQGTVITADGTNGHMYMHLVPGEENTCGMMLVGFENSGPGKSGRLGHVHDHHAKKGGSSAFLSDKSYLGNERGGRIVDLSGISGEQLGALLAGFENGYRNAAKAAQNGDHTLLDACNQLLTGKPMSVGQLKGMLQELQVQPEQIGSVEAARAGHPHAAGYEPIDPEKNPAVAVEYTEQQKDQMPRVTECEGLRMPTPPEVMKKPTFWDKVMHFLSIHSKNSYVSRYEAYQQSLPDRMNEYKENMQRYNNTLKELENGGNPNNLKEAYDRAVQQAEQAFGKAPEKVDVPKVEGKPIAPVERKASAESVELLENALLDRIFQDAGQEAENTEALTEIKNEYREHIRQTEGFQKLVRAGDERIAAVLGDSEKMEKIHADIANDLFEKMQENDPKSLQNEPQKEHVMEQKQVENAPMMVMGG